MEEFLRSGRAIDLVLLIITVEAVALVVALVVLHRRAGRGLIFGQMLPGVLAGLFLVVALRALHGGSGWTWVALALLCAGAAHALDWWLRWHR